MADYAALVEQVDTLPADWHGAGSLEPGVLRAIARLAAQRKIEHSAETGAGRSTLLFSHLSNHHTVFTVDDGASLSRVRESTLLRSQRVEFVEGPTQLTLPGFHFTAPLQCILIDGPHEYPAPDLEYFYLHRHLAPGGLLILDDIHIRTIHNLYRFLKADAMFALLEVVEKTAFFERTGAPLLDPAQDYRDRWWLQGYNQRRALVGFGPRALIRWLLPTGVQARLEKPLGRIAALLRRTPGRRAATTGRGREG